PEDVLRAVAVALMNPHGPAVGAPLDQLAVRAVATPGVKLEAKEPDGIALSKSAERRILGVRVSADAQRLVALGPNEAGFTVDHRCPRLPRFIDGSDEQRRQLLEQLDVLRGHAVADRLRTHDLHALAHAARRL